MANDDMAYLNGCDMCLQLLQHFHKHQHTHIQYQDAQSTINMELRLKAMCHTHICQLAHTC